MQPQQSAILTISNLDVTLGDTSVLSDIRLSANAGELVAVLGPNGAGKSTLLQAIGGQVIPRRGRVQIMGKNPAKHHAARRALGLVPQRIALFEKLTPKENLVAFGAIMGLGSRTARARADELLEQVGLAHRMHEPVLRLSGGMQRRINIAAALMHRPSLLVLDEPTVGLDYQAQMGIVQLFKELKADGVAVLLVTHDLDEAELLADRLAILVEGRIRALGVPAELIHQVFANQRDIKLVGPRLKAGTEPDGFALRLENLGLFPDAVGRNELSAEELTIRRAGLEMLLARCVSEAEREVA